MKFAFIYALPGYTKAERHVVETDRATFYCIGVDIANKEQAITEAVTLVEEDGVNMIELCGGLGEAHLVSKVKTATQDKVPVGAVYYGPESRQILADLVKKK